MDEQAYNDTKNQIEELDLKNQETDANGEPSTGLAGGMTQDEEEHLEFTQSLVQVREMSDKIEDSEEYKLAQSVSQDSRNKKEALKAALKRAGVQACLLKLRRDRKFTPQSRKSTITLSFLRSIACDSREGPREESDGGDRPGTVHQA